MIFKSFFGVQALKIILIAMSATLLTMVFYRFLRIDMPSDLKIGEGKNYQRVVALAPSMSETMIALKEQHRLVGVTTHLKTLSHLKRIGSFAKPNFEMILSLEPDLVLAVPHVMAQQILVELRKNHIEVFAHQPDSLADIEFINVALATKFGVKEKGLKLNQDINTAIDYAKKNISHLFLGNQNSILLTVSCAPFVVAGKNTFASQIIEKLGFINMADKKNAPWPIWPLEMLLSDPPKYLLLANGKNDSYAYKRVLKSLGVDLLSDRISLIIPKKPIFSSPSPAIIDDTAYLVRLLKKRFTADKYE